MEQAVLSGIEDCGLVSVKNTPRGELDLFWSSSQAVNPQQEEQCSLKAGVRSYLETYSASEEFSNNIPT